MELVFTHNPACWEKGGTMTERVVEQNEDFEQARYR